MIAIDLLPIAPISGVTVLKGDFRDAELLEALEGRQADVVLSDVSPNLSGIRNVDQARLPNLTFAAIDFCSKSAETRTACSCVKAFHGEAFDEVLQRLKRDLRQSKRRKPEASRGESTRNLRGGAAYFVQSRCKMDLLQSSAQNRSKSLNNMLKNLVIWLVIGLVLMTVFNQFNTRQAAQAPMEYSQFLEEVKAGRIAKVTIEGRQLKATTAEGKRVTSYSPGDIWLVSRPAEVRRQDRGQARRGALAPHEHLRLLVPDAAADRRVDLLHAPDAGRRARRRVLVRQVARAHAGRIDQHRHLRRRRGLRRGEGRSGRAGRLPARSVQVPEARRAHPARRADGRLARHRQDAARARHRGRSEGAVLLDLGLRLRRDVRRRRRGPRARHVRAGEEACAVHRVHRRDRRGRPPARRGPRRRQRRARADAEPAAGRDGRLRGDDRA